MRLTARLALALSLAAPRALAQQPADPPREWVDPDTGHRVVRLSDEAGSRTLYFHDNAYTPEGDKLIFATPTGVASIDVAKIGTPAQKVEVVVAGGARGAIMARRTREVYVARGGGGRRGADSATTQPQAPPPATQPATRGSS